MKNIFTTLQERGVTPLKMVLIVIAGIILLPLFVWLVAFAVRTAFMPHSSTISYGGDGYSMPYGAPYMEERAVMDNSQKLSVRNIGLYPPTPPISNGVNAELFEITEYYGTIRTGNAEQTCSSIFDWKSEASIIFENAHTYERGCSVVFKVPREMSDSILDRLEEFTVEDLNSNTQTIQPVLDDYTSEIEILEKKLESIEKTLTDAGKAYDEVTILATRTQDVDALAKIIDSKVQLIERLTSQRIDIKNQIEYLLRATEEHKDRVKYTVFRLTVYERVVVDGREIKDSWMNAVSQFVREANLIFQGLTVGLLGFSLRVIQFVIYAGIALFVAKYGWRFVRYVWKR